MSTHTHSSALPAPGRLHRAFATPEQEPGNLRLAVLFTDMKGSSALYRQRGNAVGRTTVRKLNDMLFPIVRANAGTVVKTIGDSIMAHFPDAAAALQAGIAMQQQLEDYNRDLPPGQDHLLIRVAINWGLGIVEERDVFGDVVNVAGKLIARCEARQILVTEDLYREVAGAAPAEFSRCEIELDGHAGVVYTVRWEEAVQAPDGAGACLLLLRAQDSASPGLEALQQYLAQRAARVDVAGPGRVQATFREPGACLEAARGVVAHVLEVAAGEGVVPGALRIGLHTTPPAEPQDVAGAVRVCAAAGPWEIALSPGMYARLPRREQARCRTRPAPRVPSRRCYILETAGTGPAPFASLLPERPLAADAVPCFYCGSTEHSAGTCPSKAIETRTQCLEALAYLPLATVRAHFRRHYAEIVRPLQAGKAEKRHDVLSPRTQQDPFSLCFHSFYEITGSFQLRALGSIFSRTTAAQSRAAAGTGSVMMGQDCLRVSRCDEAREWFERAAAEQPTDYRPHVGLALLAVELHDPRAALFQLQSALACSLSAAQKRHIRLLAARVREVSGDPAAAAAELRAELGTSAEGSHGLYYLGVLLVRAGHVQQGLAFFKRLVAAAPKYYLMIALNPQLGCAQSEIVEFLNCELAGIRAAAVRSLRQMHQSLEQQQESFHPEDGNLAAARDMVHRAEALVQQESVAGMMDVPGLQVELDRVVRRALQARGADLRRCIRHCQVRSEACRHFLKRIAYPWLVSRAAHHRVARIEQVLQQAREAAGTVPLPGPQDTAALMERLTRAAAAVDAQRTRLETAQLCLFSGECVLRTAAVFGGVALAVAVFFFGILSLYEWYDHSFAAVRTGQLWRFFRFGLIAGIVVGAPGSIVWFAKTFPQLRRKIERQVPA